MEYLPKNITMAQLFRRTKKCCAKVKIKYDLYLIFDCLIIIIIRGRLYTYLSFNKFRTLVLYKYFWNNNL